MDCKLFWIITVRAFEYGCSLIFGFSDPIDICMTTIGIYFSSARLDRMGVQEINDLAMEQLKLKGEYINLMRDVEKHLDEYRFNLSRTKTIIGFTLAEAGAVDNRDMEATAKVDVEKKSDEEISFVIHYEPIPVKSKKQGKEDGSSEEDNVVRRRKKECKGEKKKEPPKMTTINFRPFGLFEPSTAKKARAEIGKALLLICQLAQIRSRIAFLERDYATKRNELIEENELIKEFVFAKIQ
ncbi:hypothetical protein L596_007090 [Steinernema carpocapsae]|uniref:Vacuolar ATPase assembly protein VMA22 n=1 Tax=Steinernema carpocapsae TaxID=34508 RepID=A0A4U5P859_STECR|nr:hypothetical protein L596_007090 [Steinernema carpocapsae]